MSNLKIEIKEKLAEVVLNRPSARNALDRTTLKELIEALSSIEQNEAVAMVTLSGEGKVFCAGADINWMKESATYTSEQNLEDALLLADTFQAFYDFSKPIIALVHGACMGGANGLIAACDYVIAEESTSFSFSEVKLGIVPATISPFVVKRIGEFNSRELMLTGRKFSAYKALKSGLINEIAPIGMLHEKCEEYLQDLKTSGPEAMKACKRLINNLCNVWETDEMRLRTAEEIARIRATPEAKEGLSAFIEKRKPNWIKD